MKIVYLVVAILFLVEGVSYATGNVVPTGLKSSLNSLLLGLCFFTAFLGTSSNKSK